MVQKNLYIPEQAKDWIARGLNKQQIKDELLAIGIEERYIPELLKEIISLMNARRNMQGLTFILSGAGLCLISCVYTIMTDSLDTGFMLYGLTSIGVVIVFIGLMKIFG